MKKIIIMLVLIATICISMVGCAEAPTTNNPSESVPETTAPDFYEYDSDSSKDIWRVVYAEQKVYFWVNTLDNSVWVSFQGNSMTPYTINGKTVFWRGTLEETFSYDNLK